MHIEATNPSTWLTATAVARPHGLALAADERRWTYAELLRDVEALAQQLAADGIRQGDPIGVLLPNCAEYVLLIHALARLGAVLVALNTRLTAGEVAYQVQAADCVRVVCNAETAAVAHEAAGDVRVMEVEPFTPDKTPHPLTPSPTQAGRGGLVEMASTQSANALVEAAQVDIDAVQAILFTSGTTGRPKGAQITFGNHWYNALGSAWRSGVLPDDRWLVCLPLYHAGGLAIVWRSCIYATAVVLERGFNIERVQAVMDAEQVTLLSLVPTQLFRLLDADTRWPRSVRLILLGGAAATPELMTRATALGLPVATTYGMTETASQVATLTPEATREKPASVGKALNFTTIRVVGEDGTERPTGEIGEIVVQGPTVMRGYYKQDSPSLRDGVLHTGDLGYIDSDGDLWLVQRRSDLIVSGGENVYPAEVEAVLRQHPAVLEACVVGIPDAEWGQAVAAALVLKPGATVDEAELTAFCRERLAAYKRPRRFQIVESLPQTASGKVQRPAVVAICTGTSNE
jgi:O-succinylbenzoic acid--CoA ligase